MKFFPDLQKVGTAMKIDQHAAESVRSDAEAAVHDVLARGIVPPDATVSAGTALSSTPGEKPAARQTTQDCSQARTGRTLTPSANARSIKTGGPAADALRSFLQGRNKVVVDRPAALPNVVEIFRKASPPRFIEAGSGIPMAKVPFLGHSHPPDHEKQVQIHIDAGLASYHPIRFADHEAQQSARKAAMSRRKGVRILSICDDEGIRFSRELVLMQEGYEVESVSSRAFLNADWVRSFHIAVLCHTLSAECAASLAETLRRSNPEIRVLRVHSIRSRCDHYYDVDCEVLPGPSELLRAIESLCNYPAPPHQQSGRRPA
ncbi:MAG: hypothetical protein ACLGPM_08725 [Acidobacteriota bacterium]